MRSSESKSLEVNLDEVKAALAQEHRPWVRKRLVAIGKILDGKSIQQAAHMTGATRGSVERWIKQIQRSGFQSLLSDGRHGRPKRWMKPSKIAQTRRQIAAALAGPLKPQVRARLIAVDTVLSGRLIDEAAASAGVIPDTVRSWLRVLTYDGIAATLGRWEGQGKPRQLDADPVALRELAAKEMNPRIRKRILALACVAEGMSPLDAAVSVGLQHGTVLRRMKRFREEGIAAFQDPKSAGRPRKLTSAELKEVGKAVLARPELSYGDLCDLIWTRFRVRYSRDRLRRLLNVELGIEWKPVRCNAAAGNPRGGPRKLSKPELEELRDYMLKRPETSFWRLHRLVWNRFRVRRSHASLKRLLKTEFGIEWTGRDKKLGQGLNLAELQGALADTTDWRMKKRLPPGASAVHHLIDEDVRNAPSLMEVIGRFTGADFYVAHNAAFERSFFAAKGIELGPWICTYKCALRVWPDFEGHSNQELRYALRRASPFPGFERGAISPHRAASDVIITAAVFEELIKHAHWSELVQWSAEPALHTRLHFGKYRGKRYAEIAASDPDYLHWIVEKSELEEVLAGRCGRHSAT
jgi:exodeoxyribonuclease X